MTDTSAFELDPIAAKKQYELDLAVADLRDFMSRARRLRMQFDHAKNEEISAYRKVQACQASLMHCYANNPFGGMGDIIERRKAQLAEAERAWQETTLYVAQLRSEVAEVSEEEVQRFTPEVAQRMREQDGQELACANEMIVDRTTRVTAPMSLEAIKLVSKDPDVRTAMVFGSADASSRPLTAADRTKLLSRSSPSRGESPIIHGRIGNPADYEHREGRQQQIAARPNTANSGSDGVAANNSPARQSPSHSLLPFALSPVRSLAGERIGCAIVETNNAFAASGASNNSSITNVSVRAARRKPTTANLQEAHSSGLRAAAASAGVLPGVAPRQLAAVRGTAQSPLTMTSINYRGGDKDPQPVVVARPGHYAQQRALLLCDDSAESPTPAGRLNNLAAVADGPGTDPDAYKKLVNGQLPAIPLTAAQQRALEHSPFFRPGSALVYAAADASAAIAQRENNLENSKCVALSPCQISTRDRRPLSRPAYYASPAAEKVKYSVTTPNTPLTEAELRDIFAKLDTDTDGMITMVQAAKHFDRVATFGIPNHSKAFIETNLKRPFVASDLITFDEFAYLVAKWNTL